MMKKLVEFLNEYLRINAIRRMLAIVDVRVSETLGLVAFAVLFAAFEGVGLSLLLPILEYAESGEAAIERGSGVIWQIVDVTLDVLHLPITLPVLLMIAFAPILLRQVVFYLNAWYSAEVSSRIGLRLRMQTLEKVMRADPEFFTRHAVGEIAGIVLGQTGAAGAALLALIKQLSIALLMALYLAILVVISVPLTVTVVAFSLLVSAAVKANMGKIRDYGVASARISQEMMGKIVERLSLVRLIKLRNQEDSEIERIGTFSEDMRVIGVKQARLGANIEVTADPLLMLSAFVTLYVGISVLGMTLAELGLLLFVLTRLNAKVKEFNAGRQMISINVAGLLLVKEITDDAAESDTIHGGTIPFPGLQQELVLEDVHFSYPVSAGGSDTVKQVLEGIDLTVPAGSFTAIVGRSGSGKSTLVELLPRLRDVSRGSVRYDGVDVRELQVGSLRKGIGYLTQNPMLFSGTIRENLIYGLEVVPSDAEIHQALEDAFASFVFDLSDGLETVLGAQGIYLSGGEGQRVALARVLLQDTSMLILDEPTSALDSESEAFVQKALARLHGKKTVIVIAHRLATVIQADQLIVIEDGRVVERGSHAELVSHDGPYRRLFETQLIT